MSNYGKVHGVGIVDTPTKDKHIYNIWRNMIRKCYGSSKRDGSCTMVDGWLLYSTFEEFVVIKRGEGKAIRCDSSKHYSPSTCSFEEKRLQMIPKKKKNHPEKRVGCTCSCTCGASSLLE